VVEGARCAERQKTQLEADIRKNAKAGNTVRGRRVWWVGRGRRGCGRGGARRAHFSEMGRGRGVARRAGESGGVCWGVFECRAWCA
jgi:hypothetical protein